MLSLSVPAIIGMVVVGLYNFMDRVFVGQLINEVAMGAVSVSYPFTLINTGVSTLIALAQPLSCPALSARRTRIPLTRSWAI